MNQGWDAGANLPGGYGPPGAPPVGGGDGPPGAPPVGGGYGSPAAPPGGGGYGPPGAPPAHGGYGPPGAPPAHGGYGPPGAPPAHGGYGPPGAPPVGGGYGSPAAPPGGGGYGPPGAPPVGGGYGPPGAPPGGGGYGMPPAGGGYGPPGAPPAGGGYGMPPGGGGYGMPPGGAPSGGNGGLIAGLGFGCLVLLLITCFGVYNVVRKTAAAAKLMASAMAVPPVNGRQIPSFPNPLAVASAQVVVSTPTFYRTGSSKALHFAVEIKNAGTGPVSFPGAKLTLIDAAGTALVSKSCLVFGIHLLPPGESVACVGSFPKGEDYKSFTVESMGYVLPEKSNTKFASLKVSDVAGAPLHKTMFQIGYKVTGKVTNLSAFDAKKVVVAVRLFGANEQLVGAGAGDVAGTDVAIGGAAKFDILVTRVNGEAKRIEANAFGYDQ